MNKWIGSGRLTADPEIRTTQEGMTIAKFDIATDRRFKREETDFFKVVAFKSTAEFASKFLKKGTKIMIVGSLQNDNYTKKDGTKVYGMQIIADEIEFAESKKAEKEEDFEVPSDLADLPFK